MFSVIRRALGVRHKGATEDPFYPTHYFRCQVTLPVVSHEYLCTCILFSASSFQHGVEVVTYHSLLVACIDFMFM